MSFIEFSSYKGNNVYNSPIRFNKTYNILNTHKFLKSNKTPVIKISKNLKKNFISSNKILSQNYEKDFYLYNHEKILTFHQFNKNIKEKRCKTFDISRKKKIIKNLGSLHKSILNGKLVHSNLYKQIQKSAKENYIKKKREKEKNTFITMIQEEDNDNIFNFESNKEKENDDTTPVISLASKETINNMDSKPKNKILKSQKDGGSSKLVKESLDGTYKNKLVKKVSFKELFNDKNASFDSTKLKPISLPCIKFNSTLNNYFRFILEGNRNDKHTLARTCIAKLRFGIINDALSENYKTTLEKIQFPINLANTMFYYYLKEQKYFFKFDDLFKKYLLFLSMEIKKNNEELSNLLSEKEHVFNENNIILKKITDLKEELKIYKAFKNLCLMIKYKTKKLEDIPIEEIKKYGIQLNNIKKSEENKENKENRRQSISKNPRKSLKNSKSINKRRVSQFKEKNDLNISANSNIERPKEKPVFENIEEFLQKFGEENENIFKRYELYSNTFYEKRDLEKEFDKENEIEQSADYIFNKNLIKKLKNELFYLKQKNERLNKYKHKLKSKHLDDKDRIQIKILKFKNNTIEINTNNNYLTSPQNTHYYLEENENNIALFEVYKKVKKMLLNPEINIEKLLKTKKLYSIIKERKTIKDIKYNGKTYSKEVFHIKILEAVFANLIQWKSEWIKNKYIRRNYLKLKSEREKNQKIFKSKQKVLEDKIKIMKRNEDILDRINKIIILQNKKNDPFYKRYLYNEIIKKEEQKKIDEINRYKLISEEEKYYNFIQY